MVARKIILSVFILLLILTVCLIAVYWYLTNPRFISKLLPYETKILDGLGIKRDWVDVVGRVRTSCRGNPFVTSRWEMDQYLRGLYSNLGVKLDSGPGFTASSGELLSTYPLKKDDLAGKDSQVCWVVWAGDEDGWGSAGYEDVNGRFIKIQVNNFPYKRD